MKTSSSWSLQKYALFGMALFIAGLGITVCAQGQLSSLSDAELMERIVLIDETGNSVPGRPTDDSLNGKQETRLELRQAVAEVARRGPSILKHVRPAVFDEGALRHSRGLLVDSVKSIEGDEVGLFLVEVMFSELSLRIVAMDALHWRGTRGPGVGVKLSTDQLNAIIETVRDGSRTDARRAARVLSVFERNELNPRIEPVLKRFVDLVGASPTVPPPYNHTFFLSTFAEVFQTFGSPCLPYVRNRLNSVPDGNSALRDWLTIASGFAGDSTVADHLRGIVDDASAAPYIRACAVKSFTRAVGDEAVDELAAWSNDETKVVEGPENWESFPIATAATLELKKLGEGGSR